MESSRKLKFLWISVPNVSLQNMHYAVEITNWLQFYKNHLAQNVEKSKKVKYLITVGDSCEGYTESPIPYNPLSIHI